MGFLKRSDRQSFILLGFALAVIALDQGAKFLTLKLVTGEQTGGSFLGLSLQWMESYQLIFGLDFESTRLMLGAFLSVVFALFLFYYALQLIFIPSGFFILQLGITALFAGWTSNFVSRLFDGFVVHFIRWSVAGLEFSFNVANLFQIGGWILILMQISRFIKYFYTEGNRRRQLVVLRSSQLEFVFYSFLAFFCLIACFLLMNYQFLSLMDSSASVIIYPEKAFLKYSFSIFGFVFLFYQCLLFVFFK